MPQVMSPGSNPYRDRIMARTGIKVGCTLLRQLLPRRTLLSHPFPPLQKQIQLTPLALQIQLPKTYLLHTGIWRDVSAIDAPASHQEPRLKHQP